MSLCIYYSFLAVYLFVQCQRIKWTEIWEIFANDFDFALCRYKLKVIFKIGTVRFEREIYVELRRIRFDEAKYGRENIIDRSLSSIRFDEKFVIIPIPVLARNTGLIKSSWTTCSRVEVGIVRKLRGERIIIPFLLQLGAPRKYSYSGGLNTNYWNPV